MKPLTSLKKMPSARTRFQRACLRGVSSTRPFDLAKRIIKVYFIYMFEFEYDPEKSETNSENHGIDFETAKLIWDDPDALEIPAKSIQEPRSLIVGKIESKHWSAIITYREEAARIISVRRSRENEVKLYENI